MAWSGVRRSWLTVPTKSSSALSRLRGLLVGAPRARQHADSSAELVGVERLLDDVVDARLERLEPQLATFARRHDDHRERDLVVALADETTELEAVETRKDPVGEDHVGHVPRGAQRLDGGRAVRRT